MLDTNLSVDTYGKLKNVSDSHKAPVFPCYDYVAKAKEELMPKSVVDEISTLTDTCMTMPMRVVAESRLDGILQLPSVQERLSSISDNILNADSPINSTVPVTFAFKVGMDGFTADCH